MFLRISWETECIVDAFFLFKDVMWGSMILEVPSGGIACDCLYRIHEGGLTENGIGEEI